MKDIPYLAGFVLRFARGAFIMDASHKKHLIRDYENLGCSLRAVKRLKAEEWSRKMPVE
jgi:hypothetical protein